MLTEKGNKISYNEEIIKELTITPTKFQPSFIKTKPQPTEAYFQTGTSLYIPRYFQKSEEVVWRPLKKNNFKFKGKLRDYQVEPLNKTLLELKENGSCILSLGTGGGKTVMAINILSRLGLKTLIIVNKELLVDQWKERINQYIFPPPKINIIQGKNIIMDDSPIHIGMLQTISKKNKLEFNHSFLIIDEVHNCATTSFSNAFKTIGARYQLGLSATPNRADGLTKVLKWYLGKILSFERKEVSTSMKKVLAINYVNDYPAITIGRDKDIHFSLMLSKFAKDKRRNSIILAQIGLQLQTKDNYILVLSDRVSQLEYLHKKINDDTISIIYAGKMGKKKSEIAEMAKTKRVVLSSYPMFAEGVDFPNLNVLIFGTPRSNVTQSIGRIGRNYQNCLIVDIIDRYEYTTRQFIKREMIYKKQKYDKTKKVGVKIN